MTILKGFLEHDDSLFELLESSAVEAQKSVRLLAGMVRSADTVAVLEEFIRTRRKDGRISEEIAANMSRTFVTPLDEEDVAALSSALFGIPATVEKFGMRFLLCRPHVPDVDFSRQVDLLEQAVDTVVQMAGKLRRKERVETIKEDNDRLHDLESEADALALELVRSLHAGRPEPWKAIIVLDLKETLAQILGHCRDAGAVIHQIVLKYS